MSVGCAGVCRGVPGMAHPKTQQNQQVQSRCAGVPGIGSFAPCACSNDTHPGTPGTPGTFCNDYAVLWCAVPGTPRHTLAHPPEVSP